MEEVRNRSAGEQWLPIPINAWSALPFQVHDMADAVQPPSTARVAPVT